MKRHSQIASESKNRNSLESRVINNSLLCSQPRCGCISTGLVINLQIFPGNGGRQCCCLRWKYIGPRPGTYNVSNGQVWTTGKDEITNLSISSLSFFLYTYIFFFLPFSFMYQNDFVITRSKLVVIPRERKREKIIPNQSLNFIQNYLFRDHYTSCISS